MLEPHFFRSMWAGRYGPAISMVIDIWGMRIAPLFFSQWHGVMDHRFLCSRSQWRMMSVLPNGLFSRYSQQNIALTNIRLIGASQLAAAYAGSGHDSKPCYSNSPISFIIRIMTVCSYTYERISQVLYWLYFGYTTSQFTKRLVTRDVLQFSVYLSKCNWSRGLRPLGLDFLQSP